MRPRSFIRRNTLRGTGRLKPTLLCAALLLTSCLGPGSPASILRNPDANELARVHAVDEVSDVKLLWRVAMGNAPFPVRKAAAAKVLALDEEGFWKRVEEGYRGIDGVMWKWICEEAGERKEKRALEALVLRWGMPEAETPEDQRPEQVAVEKISAPTSAKTLITAALLQTNPKDDRIQHAAWFIHTRIHSTTGMRLFIAKLPEQSKLAFLKKMGSLLDEMPLVEEELEIVKAQAALPQLPNQTPVAPRGLPLARRNLLATSFTPLGPAIARTEQAPLLSKNPPSPTDIAVCAEILRGLKDPALVASLFAEADRDLADKKTEHGGVLLWNARNDVFFEAIAPQYRSHDETYLPPESLFVKLRDGLAHVHFHAQKHNNGGYAGPGRGDLLFSENNRVNAVVFTFVDENTLNVDAFFPGKIVVDLGCIKRQK